MNVSIIIPPGTRPETIAAAIAALRAQTHTSWEAIVIDGGAPPEIATAIAHSAEQDPRIRIVRRPGISINEARNSGAKLARCKWLLFFDPEDKLLPELLARLTRAAATDPSFDAVYGKWAYAAPDGALLAEEFWGQPGDMFATFASRPAFPLHACIVRTSLFEAVGGFDATCTTCADWDLWQRIARTGARFGVVDEVLALVAMRPDRDTTDLHQLLADGLSLIALGQAPDRRVANLLPPHANGLPPEQAPNARFIYACMVAGLALGRAEDPRPLLGALKAERAPGINPYDVALSIFTAALRSAGRGPAAWSELWPALERPIGEFLVALEEQSQSSGLVRRVASRLERMILEQAPLPRPLTIGTTHGICVEITEPMRDLILADPIERLHCTIVVEGEPLGTLELPVCDRVVPGYVLADAIAAQFAWPILGRYFERTIYRELTAKRRPDGVSLYQGSECLANALPDDATIFWKQAHDQIGWTIFLQEIWGRSDVQAGAAPLTPNRAAETCVALEISEPFPNVVAAGGELRIIPTVGGMALGIVSLSADEDLVAAEALRAAIAAASGFELCRAAVREGVLGRPLATPPLLRARLAEGAARRRNSALIPHVADDAPLAYDAAWAGGEALSDRDHALVLAQRAATAIGTSASRRARLPAAVARELIAAARVAGEPVLALPEPLECLTSVLYTPDVIRDVSSAIYASVISANRPGSSEADAADAHTDDQRLQESRNASNHRQSDAQIQRARSRALRRPTRAVRIVEKTLRRVNKLRSPVYRGQMLRRARRAIFPLPHIGAKIIRLAKPMLLPPKMLAPVLSRGAASPNATARAISTDRLPILMYHRVAPSGLPAMRHFRVTPDAFEAQLRYLRDAGYHSITLEDWRAAQERRKPIAGRAVMLTFDDGYVDFLTYAWPLLKAYGFSAMVFLVADHVGRSNDWDHIYGEEVPLLGWHDIHWLQRQGIVFGSHTASHHPLTSLSAEEVVREGARSRAILEHQLGAPITAIAYPYGDFDPTVQHLIGACGYRFGLSCRPGRSTLQDSALALPRIEVTGEDSVHTFVAKLQA